jgi:DNA helicase-2/ATP-dependent DNA helicase PcrA
MIDYSSLNPEQYEAVMNDCTRILTLAGAGTGKTRVLTMRMARLFETGISPANMLALTFTRAGGAEMKSRVINLIGEEGKQLFCNTFHSFCAEAVRENAELLGYGPDFSIYDQTEADELLNQVLAEMKYKITPKQARAPWSGMGTALRRQAERAMAEYKYRLKRANAMDFDGLISSAKSLMGISETLTCYRGQYKYVFVDEFQDTDPDQWTLISLLGPENLFIVGDDFQSIFGFRNADVSIILGLAENPSWKVIKLERNYRSTKPIIAAANALIKHNNQTEKKLTTDKDGTRVFVHVYEDEESEIKEIAYVVKGDIERRETAAILARTNRQLKLAARVLSEYGVPYDISSADLNPLSSHGARELLAWITAIENPNDDAAMKKVASYRVSKAMILKAEEEQLSNGGTFLDALLHVDKSCYFSDFYTAQSLVFSKDDDITAGANRLVVNLGIDDGGARYEISKWAQRQADLGEPATAKDFLNWVRICNIAEKPAKELTADKVHLMTVHGSKGLEFDEVFIIGAAQGVFPSRGDIEEERRLFYVAMTRARERLSISRPMVMVEGWSGKTSPTQTSQFIGEAFEQNADGHDSFMKGGISDE